MSNIIMRKFGVLLFLVILKMSNDVYAQLAVDLQLPPSGILQKSQLWNMVVVNPSAETVPLQVELSVFDINTGNRVLSATSNIIQVSRGMKQLRMNDMQPIQYPFVNALYEIDGNLNGLLPVGFFKICYNFFRISSKEPQLLMEECRELEIAPLSPPLLNMPADSAVVKTHYPQFSWIPPAPMQSFKGLNYELRVVELQKDQQASDAIQQNLPFAEKGNIRDPFYAYPSSLPVFDTAKFYAWQITAYNASGYNAKSEIWTFSIEKNNISALKVTSAYIGLSKGESPSLFVSDGHIKFMYENDAGDAGINWELLHVSGKAEHVVKKETLAIQGGQNFIDINLYNKRFWREGDLYRFQFVNSRGEKWKLYVQFVHGDTAN